MTGTWSYTSTLKQKFTIYLRKQDAKHENKLNTEKGNVLRWKSTIISHRREVWIEIFADLEARVFGFMTAGRSVSAYPLLVRFRQRSLFAGCGTHLAKLSYITLKGEEYMRYVTS